MFPANLRDTTLKWFDKLPPAKIDSFWELADQFTTQFITNSKVVKGLETLTYLKKKQEGSLKEYFLRYWELFQDV